MRFRFTLQNSGPVVLAVTMAACCFLPARSIRAQQVSGMEATNFKVQLENHPPPNETETKTLLEGSKATPGTNGLILLTEAKLKMFSVGGVLEMTAHSPKCIFDSMQRSISSTGSMQVWTADRKFTLEGEGFFLQQTNAHLILSNRVHTIINNVSGKSFKP